MISKAATFSLLLVFSLFTRLIPVRVPNIEPILASLMPLSHTYGAMAGFSFAILSILLYDIATHTLGVHTIATLFAYGSLGIASARYFKTREASKMNYVRFAIAGTLFFDAVTGLTVGPIFFNQSLAAAFVGQIPFTALHLLGNIVFALTLSPAITYLLKRKRKVRGKIPIPSALNPIT